MAQIWPVGIGENAVQTIETLRGILLAARGVGEHAVEQFFSPDYEESIHVPEQLSGMRAAVDRLFQARERRERVLVYGDYDADGITATALLVTVLRDLRIQVTPYLPHRLDDGYGLNRNVLEGLLAEFDLLISVDCGISNGEEIAWLKQQGKDAIIADHHELPTSPKASRGRADLPPALAILHPRLGNYPFPHLSGAGVAWKLAQGLLRDARSGAGAAAREREQALLDLAALGTLADMVPLTGENRAIAQFGLRILKTRLRVGLACLFSACRISPNEEISVRDVAFRVIPRLNAAGRMEHPQPALDVLLTQDVQRAEELVRRLTDLNTARQTVTRRVMEEAKQGLNLSLPFVFAFSPDWSAGIVGLVAGRLCEEFARPAIVVGGNGREAVGSARAADGGNVLQLLEVGRSHLLKLGGHARAAGFSLSLDHVGHFQEALSQASSQAVAPHEQGAGVDALLDRSLLSWDLLDLSESFAPYGEGNPQPTFAVRDLQVLDARTVGRDEAHLKLTLAGAYEPIEAIGFGLGGQRKNLAKRIDALFTVEANEYRGQRRLTLNLQEVARAGKVRVQGKDASYVAH